jgi:hypothetical protein
MPEQTERPERPKVYWDGDVPEVLPFSAERAKAIAELAVKIAKNRRAEKTHATQGAA